MAKIELEELFKAQAKLDATIAENHGISYETTRPRRIMAAYVEIGELANATRCFKYWSNKGPEEDDIVLDEFADGLHFLLSLGIDRGYETDTIEVEDDDLSLTDSLIKSYDLAVQYNSHQTRENYVSLFANYLRALYKIGYSWKEAKEAYYTKLAENHHRQETNY